MQIIKIIKESKGPDGNFEITIEAQVTDMIDQVMADEAAFQRALKSAAKARNQKEDAERKERNTKRRKAKLLEDGWATASREKCKEEGSTAETRVN